MKLELTAAALKWAAGVVAGLLVTAGGVVLDSRATMKAQLAVAQVAAPLVADVAGVKEDMRSLDAGLRAEVQVLREEVRQATRRMEQRSDGQEALLREVLREVRRR